MAEENPREGQPVPETALAYLLSSLDHQIGRYAVAKMLRAAGLRVQVHLDHFPGNTPDHEWIPEVGRRGWVLITKDQHVHRNPPERAAYVAAKLSGLRRDR